jgi:hypothetical protein
MIYAVKHSKVKRELYKANEDSLTATIFERLRYLPKELMHQILTGALYQTIPNLDFTKIESIEFWPSWSAENTKNVRIVEPDIFIRTTTQDIIIEAKRYDEKQQSSEQWQNEITAYYNVYQEDAKELVFIALGGLHTTEASELIIGKFHYTIYKCDWKRLLKSIKDIKFQIEKNSFYLDSNNIILHILNDLVMCFGLYGFSTAEWFNRFPKSTFINESSLAILK